MAESLSSFSAVIVACDDTLIRNIDLQKVVEPMRKNKTLPKNFRAVAKRAEEKKDVKMFLSALKNHLVDLFGFSVFLETLDSLAVQGDEKHRKILAILSHELKHLTLPTEPQSKEEAYAVQVVKRIIQTYLHVRDPDYIIGRTESKQFTSSGGTFYSDTHGVTVHISAEAIPSGVANFRLNMNASLHGPFQFPPDVGICSPIISLTCEPPIKEFSDLVQIEIPHCASELSDPEQFCVLTAQEEDRKKGIYQFYKDPDLKINLSSKFYFTVSTKHFTRYVRVYKTPRRVIVTSKRKIHKLLEKQKKATSFDEVKSKRTTSFDEVKSKPTARPAVAHSTSAPAGYEFDERSSCIQCRISMCSPRDKSSGGWQNILFVAQHHPTGVTEIEKAAMEHFRCNVSELCLDSYRFSFQAPAIYFTPESWEEAGWRGEVHFSPAVIEMDELIRQADEDVPMDVAFLECFPPKVVYNVQVNQSCQPKSIRISVEGATHCDKPVAFTIVPPLVSQPRNENRCIHVTVGLYSDESLLCQSLVSPRPNYILRLNEPDTMKFLSEISLQLSTIWRELASILEIGSSEIENLEAFACHGDCLQREACFLMLYDKWLNQQNPTLGKLLQSFQQLHIEVKLSPFRKRYPITFTEVAIDDRLLTLDLPRKIASQWKFIARLLGMAESEVENIDSLPTVDDRDLVEKARRMLEKWQMSLGVHARYLLLSNSIRVVNQHTNKLTDAVVFMQKYSCM